MARNDLISKLYAKKGSALDFNYDSLMAPPLASLIPIRDIEYMNKLVTSIKYTSKIDYKESEIKRVMSYYGFQRFASGTHRVVYRHLDIPTIIAKISLNKSSMDDNLREMRNQQYLKPFCTKVFDVYPTGLIGLFERVEPFQSREEFISVSGDIFDFINSYIIGNYVVDDIGTASFMNYGIRKAGPFSNISFGPVLLDFTEVFPLDGDKLYCNKIIDNSFICGGTLDYDEGFNSIVCKKCGKKYEARELQRLVVDHEVIKKGETDNMEMQIVRNGKVFKTFNSNKMGTDTIKPPKKKNAVMHTTSQMDMVGTPIGRPIKKNARVITIDPIFEEYKNSAKKNEPEENIFCGGYVGRKTYTDPVETKTSKLAETSEPEEEARTAEVAETEEVPWSESYNTDTGFIPIMKDIKPEDGLSESTESEELSGPEEEPYDETPTVYSSELSEETAEPADPEDELGSEDVDPDDELGEIDPAAIAASMMGGNPFVR